MTADKRLARFRKDWQETVFGSCHGYMTGITADCTIFMKRPETTASGYMVEITLINRDYKPEAESFFCTFSGDTERADMLEDAAVYALNKAETFMRERTSALQKRVAICQKAIENIQERKNRYA